MVELNEGASMPGFIWIESVETVHHTSRITVRHSGQSQCCYNCLETSPICKGGGNGRVCRGEGWAKVDYKQYMKNLYKRTGYKSLFQEIKEAEKDTAAADSQVDSLWKNVTSKATDTFIFVSRLMKNIFKVN